MIFVAREEMKVVQKRRFFIMTNFKGRLYIYIADPGNMKITVGI